MPEVQGEYESKRCQERRQKVEFKKVMVNSYMEIRNYLDVEDPVREHSTKRIGEKLYPNLKFVKTDFIWENVKSPLQIKNIIVGCSAYGVTEEQVKQFKQNGGRYMFAKNLSCREDGFIKCFPLGLEDQFMWYNFDKFDLIKSLRDEFTGNIEDSKIYLNFSLYTNESQRKLCLNSFKEKSNVFIDPHMLDKNQVSHFELNATSNFYKNVLKHRFTASPNGRGIDCQRTYEILLLGRIPVCTRNPITQSEFGRKLPILVLDSWDEFDVKAKEFLENYDESKYDFSVLSENWWLNKIKETISK